MMQHIRRDELVQTAVAQLEKPLLSYAYHMTQNIEQARDIVQEAFLRLCRAEPSRIGDRYKPWLYTVCRNLALDMKRKEARIMKMPKHETDIPDGNNPQPSQAMDMEESCENVAALVDALPQNQREAIWLKFRQGLKYREIAEVMGISASNVGFLIHRGIRMIREKLSLTAGALVNEVSHEDK
jgi:RNA polymerase sigma-70 factor (ECF subfamily)